MRFLTRGRVWALMSGITLAGAFLRFYQLGAESLWDGEIFTLLFAQFDWTVFFASVSSFSAHPPLWFALTKMILAGGWNETLLRAPAAFAGILSVPAVYVLGKRLLNERVGLLTAALLAFSPLDVIFSQNARNYAFFVLLVILLVYGAVRATDTQEKTPARWWLLFAVTALAGLYTHYLFILPFAGIVLAIALKLIYAAMGEIRNWRNVRGWWGPALVSARPFLIALIAIVALYLPWTPTVGSAFLGRQLTREAAQEDETAALTLQDAPRLLKDFSGNATWGLVLFAALAVIGIVWIWRAREGNAGPKRAALYWFGISILLPLLAMVVLAPRRLPAKYLIYVLPAYLMFVATGIGAISDWVRQVFFKTEARAFALALALVAILAVASVPNMPYWNGRATVFTGKGWQVVDDWKPWREVAASVTTRAAPGDFVLFPSEARALTARSVVPYFEDAFVRTLYGAPPTGRVWWVSETKDVPASNAATLREEKTFDRIVVQELGHGNAFQEVTLPNGGFENGLKDWIKSNEAAMWSQDTAEVAEGAASLRVTMQRARSSTVRSGDFVVTPGKLYRVTAYVKNPTVGFYTVSPQLFVNFYDASNKSPRRTRLATLVPTDKPGWVLMVADGVVPADAKTARIQFSFREYAFGLGATSWVDDVRVWIEQ